MYVAINIPQYVELVTHPMMKVMEDAIETVIANWDEPQIEGHDSRYCYLDAWKEGSLWNGWTYRERQAFVLGWGLDGAFRAMCEENEESGCEEENNFNGLCDNYSLMDILFNYIIRYVLDQVDWHVVRLTDEAIQVTIN